MKDEEMAEEYAAKQNLQNVNPSGIVRCKIAEAFLAGLKSLVAAVGGYSLAVAHWLLLVVVSC